MMGEGKELGSRDGEEGLFLVLELRLKHLLVFENVGLGLEMLGPGVNKLKLTGVQETITVGTLFFVETLLQALG